MPNPLEVAHSMVSSILPSWVCIPGVKTGELNGLETVFSYEEKGQDNMAIKIGMIFTGILLLLLSVRTVFPNAVLRPLSEGEMISEGEDVESTTATESDHLDSLGDKQGGDKSTEQGAGSQPPARVVKNKVAEEAAKQALFRQHQAKLVNFSQAHDLRRPYVLRYIIAGYASGTAFFAFSRAIWDTSKVLLVLAAAHNLAEWMLIGLLFFKDEVLLRPGKRGQWSWHKPSLQNMTAQRFMAVSFVWIWFVMTTTIMIPFKWSVIFEQISGIMCDYMLLKAFRDLYLVGDGTAKQNSTPEQQAKEAHKKALWKWGRWASVTHFGQIFPLVIGTWGFRGRLGLFAEWLLFASAGLTFFCYSEFAIEWERQHNIYYDRVLEGDAEAMEAAPGLTTNRVAQFKKTLVFGLLCGAATIIGGRSVPTCGLGQHQKTAEVTGYTLLRARKGQGKALHQALTPMLRQVRAEQGCVNYDLYTPGPMNDDEEAVLFIETWKDMDALSTHRQESEAVNTIFRSDNVRRMVAGKPQLAGPWIATDPKVMPAEGAFAVSFNVTQKIAKVWGVIDDWENHKWFQHCYRQDSITAKRRQLYFPGNVNVTCKRISNPPYDLTYEIIGLPEIEKYEVTISLEPLQDSGTSVVAAGKVIADNPKDTLAKTEERRKEMEKRVPFLQEFFSK